MTALEHDDEWTRTETGEVRVGRETLSICMPVWHWRTLAYLENDLHIATATALAQARDLVTGVSVDQVVMWYVDLTFEAVRDLYEGTAD